VAETGERRLGRDAISRARIFLKQARALSYDRPDPEQQQWFEACLEASILFGRAAIHRMHSAALKKAKGNPRLKAEVNSWWGALRGVPAVEFFREERDFILKEGPPKVGQIMYLDTQPRKVEEEYYYESADEPATETVERHLNTVEEIVADAEGRFGTSTLRGLWQD
jgi:hypothetical protein